eukprot:TRINITY_DN28446_c0_g2_i1.p1 TRINITY_DN28446_c0_g2~~TRINITY_DN28446_c0_g2_i1.p1  ORF type:complete len:130 (-),score=18.36 TRINITY_DN28446_c0_g2_i1:63-452(-)
MTGADRRFIDDLTEKGALRSGQFPLYLTDNGDCEITLRGFISIHRTSAVVRAPAQRQSWRQAEVVAVSFDIQLNYRVTGCARDAVHSDTLVLKDPSLFVGKLFGIIDAKFDCSHFDDLAKLGFRIDIRY